MAPELPSLPETSHAVRARPSDKLVVVLRARLAELRQRLRETAARLRGENRINARLLKESRLEREKARNLARQVLVAQEAERREISRELHDEIAQVLGGINVHLAALRAADDVGGKLLRRRIRDTQLLVERSVRVVHRFARELRPAMLDDLGLMPAIRAFVRDLPPRRGLRITLSGYPGVESLGILRRTVLFRVVQEALTNVTRHARASRASVRLSRRAGWVVLEVRDNGRSFQVESVLAARNPKRLGLLGMKERVEMVGGVFTLISRRGFGTKVRAALPMPAARTAQRTRALP